MLSLPYQNGMQLGQYVNTSCLKFSENYSNLAHLNSKYKHVNELQGKFSLLQDIQDICYVFTVPLAYVIKVEADVISDEIIKHCLECLPKDNAFTILFRMTYTKIKIELDGDQHPPTLPAKSSFDLHISPRSPVDTEHDKLLVKSMDIGNELIYTITFQSPDEGVNQHFLEIFKETLITDRGVLTLENINILKTVTEKIEKHFHRNIFKSIKQIITSFSKFEYCPNSLVNIVKSLIDFMNQQNYLNTVKDYILHHRAARPKTTVDVDFNTSQSVALAHQKSNSEVAFFYVKVGLQMMNTAIIESNIDDIDGLATLHFQLSRCLQAIPYVEEIERKALFKYESRKETTYDICREIEIMRSDIKQVIHNLNFCKEPTLEQLQAIYKFDPLEKIRSYIQDATTIVPKGESLQLLLLGKTGSGKSSTGNSILQKDVFKASFSTASETEECVCESNTVDGRLITVVDTPGVYDTTLEYDDITTFYQPLKVIGNSIAMCAGGVHALLIVLKYGTRFTNEEKKSIAMLKMVLGQDVLKTHSVLVFTYGDLFEEEIAFEKWLHQEHDPYFTEILKESQYRCVLFDNKTEDLTKQKMQIVQLIDFVDNFKGEMYKQGMFESAEKARAQFVTSNELLNNSYRDSIRYIEIGLAQILHHGDTEDRREEINILIGKLDTLMKFLSTSRDKKSNAMADKIRTVVNAIEKHLQRGNQNLARFKNLSQIKDMVRELHEELNALDQSIAVRLNDEYQQQGCFPCYAQVELPNKRILLMKELKVGDYVLTRVENGEFYFDQVYMFGHKEFDAFSRYIELSTATHTVTVSENHFVFCMKGDTEICLPAKDVRIGDVLVVTGEKKYASSRVTKITYTYHQGLYAPFTKSGTLIVDGVLMSCYMNVLTHKTCHRLLMPVRALFRVCPAMLGFLNGLYSRRTVPWWAVLALTIAQI